MSVMLSRRNSGVPTVWSYAITSVVIACLAAPSAVSAAVFEGLGDLPGGVFESYAYGVSADGGTVVGESKVGSTDYCAYLWTADLGMVSLGDLRDDGSPRSEAWGVSGNGSVVAGQAQDINYNSVAFRWTEAGGMSSLGIIDGTIVFSIARGISDDGTTIVGMSKSAAGDQAFRWTSATGMVGLGDLPGASFSSTAAATSSDGTTVVGSGRSTQSGYNFSEAFRWTAAEGIVPLGDLAGGLYSSVAYDVSADGSVIVGKSSSAASGQNSEAFRWTAATGMVGLGDLPGGVAYDMVSSTAYGVSGDGAIIVGDGFGTSGTRATIWDAANGMRDLTTVLTGEYGLDLTGWTLYQARAISDNGQVIVGYGRNPSGQTEAWRADLATAGDAEGNPILPSLPDPDPQGAWVFEAVSGTGHWFDPFPADGYIYQTDGNSSFVSITLPAGVPDADGMYTVSDGVNGTIVLAAGSTYDFAVSVDIFTIMGIDPPVDGEDPLAFPTYIVFDQPTVSFTMTPIPEPATLALLTLAGLAVARRRR